MSAPSHASRLGSLRPAGLVAAVAAAVLAGACAQNPLREQAALAEARPADAAAPSSSRTELQKATDYWGKAYSKDPRDLKSALSYARNLKAMGEKQQALGVLQQASVYHGTSRELSGEYGRLALDIGQVQLAHKLLEMADDPANPDWRIISARGTVYAKQGQYKEAIPFYERALTLSHNNPSILNNLAMAQAAEGQAAEAETLLKRAAEAGADDAQVRQNLALVLGLQGKYDEAKQVASRDLPADAASANVDYVRRMVRRDPASAGGATEAIAPAVAQAAPGKARPGLRSTAVASDATSQWTTTVAQGQPQGASAPALRKSAQ